MRLHPALVAMVFVTSAAVAEGPRFTQVPHAVRGMNLDGTIVSANGPYEGYSGTGLIYNLVQGTVTAITNPPAWAGIGPLTSLGSYAAGGSPTGTPASTQAYRFSIDGNHTLIGKRPGTASSGATAISGDGNVVAGHSDLIGNGVTRFPFRWTPQTGRQEIGPPEGTLGGGVKDISRDGSTIIGAAIVGNIASWYWREGTGMTYLPALSPAGTDANAVSADGNIIAGISRLSTDPYDKYVVRWVNGVIHPFPLPAGMVNPGVADMSDDGNVIVGGISIPGVVGAWGMVCTPDLGLMFAHDYLAMYGVTIPAGVQIERVYTVSADGLTIGGSLRGGGGFVATVPAPGVTGLLAAASLLALRRRR